MKIRHGCRRAAPRRAAAAAAALSRGGRTKRRAAAAAAALTPAAVLCGWRPTSSGQPQGSRPRRQPCVALSSINTCSNGGGYDPPPCPFFYACASSSFVSSRCARQKNVDRTAAPGCWRAPAPGWLPDVTPTCHFIWLVRGNAVLSARGAATPNYCLLGASGVPECGGQRVAAGARFLSLTNAGGEGAPLGQPAERWAAPALRLNEGGATDGSCCAQVLLWPRCFASKCVNFPVKFTCGH